MVKVAIDWSNLVPTSIMIAKVVQDYEDYQAFNSSSSVPVRVWRWT